MTLTTGHRLLLNRNSLVTNVVLTLTINFTHGITVVRLVTRLTNRFSLRLTVTRFVVQTMLSVITISNRLCMNVLSILRYLLVRRIMCLL